jgi:L-iditol 2-dehydrogenase
VAAVNFGAVLHGAGDLRVEELPMPEPGPEQVLVAMRAVGICGSDVHYYETGGIGPFVVRQPQVLGHEPFGVIAGLGSAGSRHRLGQRVVVEPGVPCGRCPQCRSGSYNLCRDIEFLGNPPVSGTSAPVNGALARYVAVHEDFVHPVPRTVSDAAAALIEPLAVALHAVRRARIEPGSTVLITGAGPIGLLAAQAARAAGATTVVVTDVRDEPLAHARRLGATAVNVSAGPLALDGMQHDVFLECSGNSSAMADGIGQLGPHGTAVLVGVGPEEAALPVATIRRREITVTATFRYANAFPAALALAAAGSVDLEGLITDRVRLEQVPESFRAAVGRRHGRGDATGIKTLVDLDGAAGPATIAGTSEDGRHDAS